MTQLGVSKNTIMFTKFKTNAGLKKYMIVYFILKTLI